MSNKYLTLRGETHVFIDLEDRLLLLILLSRQLEELSITRYLWSNRQLAVY